MVQDTLQTEEFFNSHPTEERKFCNFLPTEERQIFLSSVERES